MQPAYFIERPAACLLLSGEDTRSFLHNQGTQDFGSDAAPRSGYTLLLDHKGRIQADAMVVFTDPEHAWVYSMEVSADALLARFDRYIITDDVTVEDHTREARIVLLTATAAQTLCAQHSVSLPDAGGSSSCGAGCLVRGRHLGPDSFEWILPDSDWPAPADWAALTSVDKERMRIECGVPAIPRDLNTTHTPLAGGLMDALSFTKGCYLGQEVVARQHRLARQNLRLVRLRSGSQLEPEQELFAEGTRVGEVTSSAAVTDGWIGIGRVKGRYLQSPLFAAADPVVKESL